MAESATQTPQRDGEHQAAVERMVDRLTFRLRIAGSLIVVLLGVVWWWAIGGRLGRALGANFISAGGIALVAFVVYEQLSRSLEEIRVQQTIDAAFARSLRRFRIAKKIGLIGCDETRPVDDLNKKVIAAEKTVDILEISLKTMQDIDAEVWRNCKAKVRIILLDPTFPIKEGDKGKHQLARLRDAEEHEGDGQILKEINEIMKKFPPEWFSTAASPVTDGPPGQSGPGIQHVAPHQGDAGPGDPANANGTLADTHVKLAQVMPTMSYFRIDNIAYFAPLLHRLLGHTTMHLQLEEGGQLFAVLERHFDKLWMDKDHVVDADPSKIPEGYAKSG